MSKIKPKLILMVGPPGSGKTTYCRKMMKKLDVRVSLDDVQQMLGGAHYKNYRVELKDFYEEIQRDIVENALGWKLDVWVDNTNMSIKDRAKYMSIAHARGAEIVAVDFTRNRQVLTDEILLERRMNESRGVKESTWKRVIQEMWARYEDPCLEEGLDLIQVISPADMSHKPM